MTDILAQVGANLASVLEAAPVQITGRLVIAYILLLWLAAAIWVFHDSRRRMTNHVGPYLAAGTAILATPLLTPLVLVLYRLVRPARTADEVAGQRLNTLVASVAPVAPRCPGCDAESDEAWRVCPYCSTELHEPCPRCTRMVDLGWAICPWCAYEVRPLEQPEEELAEEPVAAAVEVRRRQRHPARAAQPAPQAGALVRPRHATRLLGRRAHVPDVAT